MAIEIHVPDIGADEVEVTEILVNVGDTVEVDQSLITVEGDKASMEVPAAQAGTVKEIKVAKKERKAVEKSFTKTRKDYDNYIKNRAVPKAKIKAALAKPVVVKAAPKVFKVAPKKSAPKPKKRKRRR